LGARQNICEFVEFVACNVPNFCTAASFLKKKRKRRAFTCVMKSSKDTSAWEKQMNKMGLTKYGIVAPPFGGEFEKDGMSKHVTSVMKKGPKWFADADQTTWEECAPWVAREGAKVQGFCDDKRRMAETMTLENADHLFPMLQGASFIGEMAWLAKHAVDVPTQKACAAACETYRDWLRRRVSAPSTT
jgi:hypothetical protein